MAMGIQDVSPHEEEYSIVLHPDDVERTAENLQQLANKLSETVDKINSFSLSLEPNGILVLKTVVPKA